MWILFLTVSGTVLVLSFLLALINGFSRYKSTGILTPTRILSVGVGLSAVMIYVPIAIHTFDAYRCGVLESVLISFNSMVKLFVADADFESAMMVLPEAAPEVLFGYRVVLSILFVMAPLMTFGFVLSFFKNLTARLRLAKSLKREIVVFSELNERSLALARDLAKNRKRLLVFTDVFEKEEELTYELLESAKELGAIFFKKDITMLELHKRKKKALFRLFIMGGDKAENLSQSILLIKALKYRPNTYLYLLSTREEDDLLLVNALNSGVKKEECYPEIRVRRINEVTSLVFHNLYEKGYENIFQSAKPMEGQKKAVNAVIVGMGLYGTEMVKAMPWFCQMTDYELHLHAFDADINAKDRFCSLCPELMDDKLNGHFDIAGETRYEIDIHAGYDVTTKRFDDKLASLPPATYVFVAVGDDDCNLTTSLKLRMLYKRMGLEPVIQTVIYNTEKRHILDGIANFKKQEYNIDFIGDMKKTFSEQVILSSALEEKALARHTKWGNTREDIDAFWHYSYNYKSSVASAIHRDMKIKCGVPGADKLPDERPERDRVALRILEHCRWNAYMRSEGYVYSGSLDPISRDDLAKKHHCLVPFDQLSLKEQEKDDD